MSEWVKFVLKPPLLRNRQVLFCGDNTSSISACVHGYSRSPELGRLSNEVHLFMAKLNCDVFFIYVPTDANIADIPSRDPLKRTKELVDILEKFGLTDARNKRRMVLPSIEVLRVVRPHLHTDAPIVYSDSSVV